MQWQDWVDAKYMQFVLGEPLSARRARQQAEQRRLQAQQAQPATVGANVPVIDPVSKAGELK
jgi:hypothetical protein